MLSLLVIAPVPLLAAEGDDAVTGGETASPPPVAAPEASSCQNGVCRYRLTASEMLARAEKLVSEHRFSEAAPLLEALELVPQLSFERDFLKGYAAIENGRVDEAIKMFRKILVNHPEQTRVRLELARALQQKGKSLAADYHFRLAQQDKGLPAEVRDYVRTSRAALRNTKAWSFNTDFGVAPDSNITNGTAAQTVDVRLGPTSVPLTLDGNARARSGTGQFLTFSGSGRIGLKGESRLVVDTDTGFTNYRGKRQDDGYAQLAIGPEFDVGTNSAVSVQGIGAVRLYGGQVASRAFGGRTSFSHYLSDGQRIGVSFDARRTISGFSPAFSGWQLSANASYERVISRRFIGSASLFARRDALNSKGYANVETGVALALGGDLPHGLTAGVSIGGSRAWFDQPLTIFSLRPRSDWRLNARATLGLRSLRVLGFSPSVSYSRNDNLSNYTLFKSDRSRVRFALARYF